MSLKDFSLEKFLNSASSSPSYAQGLNSYLYNTNGIKVPRDRIPFIISTVDESGTPQIYSLDETTMSIVGLTLAINPSSVSVNMSKMISRVQTMSGWLEEHWGEELDTITFSGSTAGFIFQGVPNVPPPEPGLDAQNLRDAFNAYSNQPDTGTVFPDSNGLATSLRRETASYQEFKKIINLMNANAASFDIRGLVSERLYIEMSYDYACYRGYIESIDTTEDAASPFRFTYTITFKAEKTIYYFSGNPGSDYIPNINGSENLKTIAEDLVSGPTPLDLSASQALFNFSAKPVLGLPISNTSQTAGSPIFQIKAP